MARALELLAVLFISTSLCTYAHNMEYSEGQEGDGLHLSEVARRAKREPARERARNSRQRELLRIRVWRWPDPPPTAPDFPPQLPSQPPPPEPSTPSSPSMPPALPLAPNPVQPPKPKNPKAPKAPRKPPPRRLTNVLPPQSPPPLSPSPPIPLPSPPSPSPPVPLTPPQFPQSPPSPAPPSPPSPSPPPPSPSPPSPSPPSPSPPSPASPSPAPPDPQSRSPAPPGSPPLAPQQQQQQQQAAPTLPTSDPDLGGGNCSDVSAVVTATNAYRAWHQSPPLTWDPSLAADAQAYAEVLAAQQCDLEHAGVGGECLYNLETYPKPDWSCKRAIDAWYSEVKVYDFTAAKPYDYNWPRGTGHFVQLVWRSSVLFGCGVGKADVPMPRMPGGVGGCKVIVCRFRSGFKASNSEYKANVLPRAG